MTYLALLVDYGGVLTTSLSASFAAFCMATGASPERLRDVLAAAYSLAGEAGVPMHDMHDVVRAVETGAISQEEFDRRLASSLSEGLDRLVDPANLTARLFGELRPDERMRRAVARARRLGLLTGMISNTWGVEPPPEIGELFDEIVLSGREGVRKPDPEIFLLAAGRLKVAPAACVFVDDIPVNLDGARAVGMMGVLHRDAAITIPRLEELLDVSLDADRQPTSTRAIEADPSGP
jgi:putative hydrolase of the HAD superfamily